MLNATEQWKKIRTEKCPLELGEKNLLVIIEKLFFSSSESKNQIVVGWVRENRTSADSFFKEFMNGRRDRQTDVIINSLSWNQCVLKTYYFRLCAQFLLLYPQNYLISFVFGFCLCFLFLFFSEQDRSLFLPHT